MKNRQSFLVMAMLTGMTLVLTAGAVSAATYALLIIAGVA